jgi:hypothetical protein
MAAGSCIGVRWRSMAKTGTRTVLAEVDDDTLLETK